MELGSQPLPEMNRIRVAVLLAFAQPSGRFELSCQTHRVRDERTRRPISETAALGGTEVIDRSRIVSRHQGAYPDNVLDAAAGLLGRVGDLLLNVVAAEHPQRESTKRRSGEYEVKILDRPQGIRTVGEDAIDR